MLIKRKYESVLNHYRPNSFENSSKINYDKTRRERLSSQTKTPNMSTSRGVAYVPILSPLSLQILRRKNLPGQYNVISPLNHRNGCRTLVQPLPTDPTRSFDYPPQIPEHLNSIWTLHFIGFTLETANLIWKHYDLISTLPLPSTSSSSSSTSTSVVHVQQQQEEETAGRNQADSEHHLLHVAKTHVRTRAENSVDKNFSVNQAMGSMGLGKELRDAVMNYAMDQLRGVQGAESMLKDTANLQGWTVAVVEKRWISLVDLDRVIIELWRKEC